MSTFNDALGRSWTLEVDIPARDAVMAATDNKVDIIAVFNEGFAESLKDVSTLVTVLFTLCEEQAAKLGLDKIQFSRGLKGDASDAASEALMQAIADFFPKTQRLMLNKAMAKSKEKFSQMMNKVMEKMDSPETTSSESATNSPESVESKSVGALSDS